MEYTRVQIVLGGGPWRRGTPLLGAVEGAARAVVVDPAALTVLATIVAPRRAKALGQSPAETDVGALPPRHALIEPGQTVRAILEDVGHVSRVWSRGQSEQLTHLLVREAAGLPRRGRERVVPVEYIESLATESIALSIGAAHFRLLPEFRPDDAILADVQAALESVLADPRARRQVKVRVDDGQVTLGGEVDTVDQARLAERSVMAVPGVRAIVLDLVAQETLAAIVEERIAALGAAIMNGHGPIAVFSEHGIVYLEGSVPTTQARQQVEQVALAAAGAKVVVNNLRINGDAPERGPGTGPLVRNK
jgi:osmotically-inducible protein OsmY